MTRGTRKNRGVSASQRAATCAPRGLSRVVITMPGGSEDAPGARFTVSGGSPLRAGAHFRTWSLDAGASVEAHGLAEAMGVGRARVGAHEAPREIARHVQLAGPHQGLDGERVALLGEGAARVVLAMLL